MIDQYKKTLVPTQIAILVVSIAALLWSHRIIAALSFFVVMQLCALLGAMWGARLKGKIERAMASR
jgi:hypothetical protein